ncbi:MAG TPA: methylmalonyl-CoA mutase family protein [Edaphocola sp.]|nr:methylmalonyl-CoA mutase family protein [Edaphocola sp.]
MEDLLKGFEAADAKAWKQRIEKDLKGITFEQLQRLDTNGITIDPFYVGNEQSQSAVFNHIDWEIISKIDVDDESVANQEALYVLNSGTTALYFNINIPNPDWSVLFKGIEMNFINTYIRVSDALTINTESLQAYILQNNISSNNFSFGRDGYAAYFRTKDTSLLDSKDVLAFAGKIDIDNGLYFNSGANSVTQLAMAISHLQEELHNLSQRNSINLLRAIEVEVASGTYFFEEIAKLRALRQLIALLLQQYGLAEVHVKIIAHSGKLQQAAFDIYNNLLRSTISGMAAVLGGCDALCISRFDEVNEKGNKPFSLRMALNQQLIFKEESYLNSIADVANGSYFIEELTKNLAEKAWDVFKKIEQEGGCLQSFDNGTLQKRIQEEAKLLIEDYQIGKKLWVGINKYPNPKDLPVQKENALKLNTSVIQELNLLDYLSFDK